MPGGHVEEDETFEEAAVRETFEETKLIIKEEDLEYVFESLSEKSHVVKFYFINEYKGEVEIDYESNDYAWVSKETIDEYEYTANETLKSVQYGLNRLKKKVENKQ